jgi:hypothetical protein
MVAAHPNRNFAQETFRTRARDDHGHEAPSARFARPTIRLKTTTRCRGGGMLQPAQADEIEQSIRLIRGQRVMLDSDLAELYGVETRTLIQAVQRNIGRFPDDFMFRLSRDEFVDLRSQSVISSRWGGRRYPPYAFTEQGVAMLSSVLGSERAVGVNIEIMRTFVRVRSLLADHKDLARRMDELERRYDGQFSVVFDAIRQLITPPDAGRRRRLGFPVREDR